MNSPFLKSLQCGSKDVHPELLADHIPACKFKSEDRVSENSYDNLTDDSKFSDYAWAFLRRNRFYQALVDKRNDAIGLELWGHKPSTESPAIYGLTDLKPYDEPSGKGVPLTWWGIHSFAERHTKPHTQRKGVRDKIDFKKAQVHFVFDIDAVLGPGTTAIDIQVKIASNILFKLASDADFNKGKRLQKPPKAHLRSMLRVADLLSPERDVKLNDGENAGDVAPLLWDIELHKNLSRMQAVARKLLESDLGKASSNDQKAKRASDLAKEAFISSDQHRSRPWLVAAVAETGCRGGRSARLRASRSFATLPSTGG